MNAIGRKKSLFGLLLNSAILLNVALLASCNSEETLIESTEPASRVMYAAGSYQIANNPQSRTSYEDNFTTNYMKLTWSSGDKFSAFVYGSTVKNDFEILTPDGGRAYTASETFRCNNFSSQGLSDGAAIDAIYPAVATAVNPKNILLDLSNQTQEGNESTAHLSTYDYMVGHATYDAANPNNLNFNFKDKGDGNSGRLASIYRLRLVLPAAVTTVKKITLSTTDEGGAQSLVLSEKVNITNGSTSTIPVNKGAITLTVNNGTTQVIDGKNTFTAYVMLFPSAVKTRTISLTANDDIILSEVKTYDSETIYTRGQFHLINAELKPATEFKSSYLWVPGDHQNWNLSTALRLYSWNNNDVYTGYVYLNGKFRLDNLWTGTSYTYTSFTTVANTVVSDNGDLKVNDPGGYYYLTVNLGTQSLEATQTTWSLIGDATPGGWATDTPMTYNSADNTWRVTVTLTDGNIKFRANGGWDLNLGGALNNLQLSGSNIAVTAGTYEIILHLKNDSNHFCEMIKQ